MSRERKYWKFPGDVCVASKRCLFHAMGLVRVKSRRTFPFVDLLSVRKIAQDLEFRFLTFPNASIFVLEIYDPGRLINTLECPAQTLRESLK